MDKESRVLHMGDHITAVAEWVCILVFFLAIFHVAGKEWMWMFVFCVSLSVQWITLLGMFFFRRWLKKKKGMANAF